MTDLNRSTIEITTSDLRARLAGVLNDVAVRGQIVYVTNHGRRVAAIVPVPMAEQIEDRPG
jgi:prevent-host-death family protein